MVFQCAYNGFKAFINLALVLFESGRMACENEEFKRFYEKVSFGKKYFV